MEHMLKNIKNVLCNFHSSMGKSFPNLGYTRTCRHGSTTVYQLGNDWTPKIEVRPDHRTSLSMVRPDVGPDRNFRQTYRQPITGPITEQVYSQSDRHKVRQTESLTVLNLHGEFSNTVPDLHVKSGPIRGKDLIGGGQM